MSLMEIDSFRIPFQIVRVVPTLTKESLRKEKHGNRKNECYICGEYVDDSGIEINGKRWHKDCFSCDLCRGKIVGEKYCRIENHPLHIFCGLSINGPHCYVCSKPIVNSEVVEAFGKYYHQNCLQCSLCRTTIKQDEQIDQKRGIPVCSQCTYKVKKHCLVCHNSVERGERFLFNGKVFYVHSECCHCSECKTKIKRDTFVEESGVLMCKSCWIKVSSNICQGCNKIVLQKDKVQFQGVWHSFCISCSICGKRLDNSIPNIENNNLYCNRCFESLNDRCAVCKIIMKNDEKIERFNRFFHRTCLNCTKCGQTILENNAVFEKNGLVCLSCHHKK